MTTVAETTRLFGLRHAIADPAVAAELEYLHRMVEEAYKTLAAAANDAGTTLLGVDTASRAVVTDASSNLDVSATTAAEVTALGALTASKAVVTNASSEVVDGGASAAEITALGALGNSLAVVTDGSGSLVGSATTAAQVGYLSALSSDAQAQIDGKAATSHAHSAADVTSGTLVVGRGGTGVTGFGTSALVQAGSGGLLETLASPTLAEIAHVGGVTSALQTQLNAKRSATALGWRLDKNGSDQGSVGTGATLITWSSAGSLAFVAGVTFTDAADSITILTAGKYTVGAQLRFDVVGDQNALQVYIDLNGAGVQQFDTRAASSGLEAVAVVAELNLAVNDVLKVYGANTTSADNVEGTGTVTFFWGVFHGT